VNKKNTDIARKFNEFVGSKIKELRKSYGMTQMDLAYKLGYESSGMISQVENGLRGMSLSRIRKCADLFNVQLGVLLRDKEHSFRDQNYILRFEEVLSNKHKYSKAILALLEDE